MNLRQLHAFHKQLDERIVGYVAWDPLDGFVFTMDGAVVVCAKEEAMIEWTTQSESCPMPDYSSIVYGDIIESFWDDPVSWVFDLEALAIFMKVLAQDLRFVPQIDLWESGPWTLLEPTFKFLEDDPDVLREQINRFIVGYCTFDPQKGILTDSRGRRIISGRPKRDKKQTREIVAGVEYRSLLAQESEGFYFHPDDLVSLRAQSLLAAEQYCDDLEAVDLE